MVNGNYNNDTDRFNRTFMELKYYDAYSDDTPLQVLIVPLWNWNISIMVAPMVALSFNRTFMELKYWRNFFEQIEQLF